MRHSPQPSSLAGARHLFLLGAAKCGTTSMSRWLGSLPEVLNSAPKEPQFFPLEFEDGVGSYLARYFPSWSGSEVLLDDQHRNLYLPFVLDRIEATSPNPRFVVLIRDPVDRSFSHWWYRRLRGIEGLDFEPALRADLERLEAGLTFEGEVGARRWAESCDGSEVPRGVSTHRTYLDSGYYGEQIQRYVDRFGEDRVQVLLLDEAAAAPGAALAPVLGAFGVTAPPLPFPTENSGDRSPRGLAVRRVASVGSRYVPRTLRNRLRTRLLYRRGGRPTMKDSTRKWLLKHYEPHNRGLEELLGRELPPEWYP